MDQRGNDASADIVGLKGRLAAAMLIGLISAFLCWLYHSPGNGAGDFTWVIHGAEDLLAGRNPYTNYSMGAPLFYPLPAVFVALPLVGLPYPIAAALFFGISSALLAFGLAGSGYTRLLVFLSAPYWISIQTLQWSPLLMSIAFFPILLPLTLAKPTTAGPVGLLHLTKRGILLSVAVGLLSLALIPTWPLSWLANLNRHNNFIPLLTIPGILLLVALLRYKDRDVWLFLLVALVPQRLFYDQLNLWLIPQSKRDLIGTALMSWVGFLGWSYFPEGGYQWVLGCFYLPILVVILQRGPMASSHTLHSPQP